MEVSGHGLTQCLRREPGTNFRREPRSTALTSSPQKMAPPSTTRRVHPSPQTIGLVADVGPGMGKVEVWVNGQFVKTIDLSAATARARTVVGNVRLPWTTVVNVKLVARNTPPEQGHTGTHVALDG